MSRAVLLLNDQSLAIRAADGQLHNEPGFARISDTGIESGEAARATAWLEPQSSYNQYWCHLNITPLASREAWARHHADIAFAQLRQLWRSSGRAEELVLLVPGSLGKAQLSLLLGLVAALPARVAGVIDSAVAAVATRGSPSVFVDVHLHQSVISLVEARDGLLEITQQEIFPNLGLLQVQNTVARHVSNLLIDSARFDPLHSSDTEQFIFDSMPAWIEKLRWDGEFSAALATAKGELPFILRRDPVTSMLGERLASVRAFLGRHAAVPRVLAQGAQWLSGLVDDFRDADLVRDPDVLAFVAEHASDWLTGEVELRRLSRVPQVASESAPAAINGRRATHLLFGDCALPIGTPVSIRVTGSGLDFSSRIDDRADLTVVAHGDRLETLRDTGSLEVRLPESLTPGETLALGEHRVTLIEVRDA